MYNLELTSDQIDDITVEGLGNFYVNTLDLTFPYPEDVDVETLITIEKMLTYFVPEKEYDVHIKYLRDKSKPNNTLIESYLK